MNSKIRTEEDREFTRQMNALMGRKEPYLPHQCHALNCTNEAEYGKRYCSRCREEIAGEPLRVPPMFRKAVGFTGCALFTVVIAWIAFQYLFN